MADLEIRPTMRFIAIRYAITLILLAAALFWWAGGRDDTLGLAPVVGAAALLLWPLSLHWKRQRIRCLLDGGQLRYESGLVTTSVKSLPVANIQDVTVRTTLVQKLFGVGDLRIETAGQGSGFEIANVEQPHKAAEIILAAAAKR